MHELRGEKPAIDECEYGKPGAMVARIVLVVIELRPVRLG